jgi:CheY-like chemotaxis protein
MSERATILVCDDEELIRWSLAEQLQSEGYRVLEAVDGVDCLEKIRAHAPDLVITDMKMPRMDGMEVLRRLREEDRELPVIVLTAMGAADLVVEATQLGARAYLAKPFDLREVGLAVGKVLDQFRLSHEVRYLRGQAAAEGYPERLEQVAADERSEHSDDDVADDPIAAALHEQAGQPAGEQADHDKPDCFHLIPSRGTMSVLQPCRLPETISVPAGQFPEPLLPAGGPFTRSRALAGPAPP